MVILVYLIPRFPRPGVICESKNRLQTGNLACQYL